MGRQLSAARSILGRLSPASALAALIFLAFFAAPVVAQGGCDDPVVVPRSEGLSAEQEAAIRSSARALSSAACHGACERGFFPDSCFTVSSMNAFFCGLQCGGLPTDLPMDRPIDEGPPPPPE